MNIEEIRKDFPILQKKFNGKPIIYLDNACTTQKPKQMVDAVVEYYTEYTGCVGRFIHKLSMKTQEKFEGAREEVAKFVNARNDEIVWTKNTTEGINLVSKSFNFKKGDRVVITNLEHSSNLLPWQILADNGIIDLDFVLSNEEGEFNVEDFENKIDRKTKLVSVIFTSNVTGTTTPIKEITKIAHDNGAIVLADGAQAVPHMSVDVKKLVVHQNI